VVVLWSSACGSSALSNRNDAAPGDGGGHDGVPVLGELEGIYTIEDVTLNSSSCTIEGPSVLASQTSRMFAAAVAEPGGTPLLTLVGCTDATDCRSKAQMERNGSVSGAPWSYIVHGTGPGNGGDTLATGTPSPQCTGETLAHATITVGPGGTLRIQIQITDVPAHDAVGGTCTVSATEQAAATVPCNRLEVITGSYQQPL